MSEDSYTCKSGYTQTCVYVCVCSNSPTQLQCMCVWVCVCTCVCVSVCVSMCVHVCVYFSDFFFQSGLTNSTQEPWTNKYTHIGCEKFSFELLARVAKETPKTLLAMLLPLVNHRGLCCWRCHAFETGHPEDSSWIWPESLFPED